MSEKEYTRIREKFASEEIDVIFYRSPPLDAPLETPLPKLEIRGTLVLKQLIDWWSKRM